MAVLVILYLFKSGRLTKGSFVRLFNSNNIPFIIFSGSAFLGAQILAAFRIILLLKTVGFPLRFFQGIKLTMVGNFFNVVIPGMIGGDIVKGFYLFKNEENNRGRSSGIIVMDRILGLIAILLISGISIVYLLQQKNAILNPYLDELYVISLIILSVLVLASVFFIFGRNLSVRKKLKEILTAVFRNSMFYHMAESFGTLAKHRGILLNTVLISLLIQLLSLSGLLVLGNILSEELPALGLLVAVTSIVIVIGSIPVTPGNIGWTELIASFGWSAIGSNAGAEIFFYWRLVIVFISLAAGLPCLFMTQNYKQILKEQKNSVIT